MTDLSDADYASSLDKFFKDPRFDKYFDAYFKRKVDSNALPKPIAGKRGGVPKVDAAVPPRIVRDSPESPDPSPPLSPLSPLSPLCDTNPLFDKNNDHEKSKVPLSSPTKELASPPELMDVAMEASSSESETSDCSSSTSSDGYTTVVGKGKKRARKAKKAAAGQAPAKALKTVEATQSTDLQPPAPMDAAPISRPASPCHSIPQAPKKAPTPPPIYIQDKAKWTDISKWCVDKKVNYTQARNTQQGIKVQVPSPSDFRTLTNLLREKSVSFHTYALQEERLIRVVIRGVPIEIDTSSILSDLKSQQIPVVEVHRMHRARGGPPFAMVLVVCEQGPGSKALYNLKTLCHLSGIKVENPHKSGYIGQCHNCQLYGHAQRNCFAKPRCVKCLGDHSTNACDRPKDRSLCTEPPSCVLCGESGHPANYRGCPKAPKKPNVNTKLAKRNAERNIREQPSSKLPERLSPQRPSPWNALNHQQAFPTLKPSPATQPTVIPPLMANPIPAPIPIPIQLDQVAPASPPKQAFVPRLSPARSSSQPTIGSDLEVVQSVFSLISSDRFSALAQTLRSMQGNGFAILQVMLEYKDITDALANINFNGN